MAPTRAVVCWLICTARWARTSSPRPPAQFSSSTTRPPPTLVTPDIPSSTTPLSVSRAAPARECAFLRGVVNAFQGGPVYLATSAAAIPPTAGTTELATRPPTPAIAQEVGAVWIVASATTPPAPHQETARRLSLDLLD